MFLTREIPSHVRHSSPIDSVQVISRLQINSQVYNFSTAPHICSSQDLSIDKVQKVISHLMYLKMPTFALPEWDELSVTF